jgi:manganese/zinc/iron transport system permease protein
MSSLFVAPAIAATALTKRLSLCFYVAAFIGILSSFLGVFLSIKLPELIGEHLLLPTGPLIVLIASFFALLALVLKRIRKGAVL